MTPWCVGSAVRESGITPVFASSGVRSVPLGSHPPHELPARPDAELAIHVGQVRLDRLLAQEQRCG